MRLAMVGLGRMGMNMARRLLKGGHQVVAYNRTWSKTEEIAKYGAEPCRDLRDLKKLLPPPRIVWLMLPAGSVIDLHLGILEEVLAPEDIVVDGGNSYYKDDMRRAALLESSGIRYADVGTSGGVWGLTEGYCLMFGGDPAVFTMLEPALKTLATDEGYLNCGPSGSGHFVKMVHNGIEYAMMQAYAEGFSLLESSPYSRSLDYSQVARLWNSGSVIRSWLLELAENAFAKDPKLARLRGYVEDSGEGRWTVQQAVEVGEPAPVIALSLMERFRSRKENAFGDRLLAALRNEFGGHAVKTEKS